jgi:hypothetical protein
MRPDKFAVISIMDEAIDTKSIAMQTLFDYNETRDLNVINQHYKPGQTPTIYHVRAVPHSLWESYVCSGGTHDEIRFRRAFICGIERVENLRGNDGVSVPWTPTREVGEKLVMSEDECNERFSPSEVLEIGAVIYKHSFLPRRITITYPLQPSLAEPLGHLEFRSAAPSQSTAPTTNSSHSSSSDPQPTATASI